jgi:PPM family protein phosphatase
VRLPAGFDVGTATHTGCVRVNNEDDYLVGALLPPDSELLFSAIADGMGGAAGGAEASRSALRALARIVLDGASQEPLDLRLQAGFQEAARRIAEQATAVPALRDMGTTLSVLCMVDGRAFLGHVGDTRIYLLRDGKCEALTVDHAVREPDNLLLRCVGGGQANCVADLRELETRPGDRFVLVSDGIWSVVPETSIQRLAGRGPAIAAAEALVGAALVAGGPDNATALVVAVEAQVVGAPAIDVPLPREERPTQQLGWPPPESLRPPWWPWLLLLGAALFAVLFVLRLGFGIDGWGWLRSQW